MMGGLRKCGLQSLSLQTLLHMASTGNWTPDIRFVSQMHYPLGHVVPKITNNDIILYSDIPNVYAHDGLHHTASCWQNDRWTSIDDCYGAISRRAFIVISIPNVYTKVRCHHLFLFSFIWIISLRGSCHNIFHLRCQYQWQNTLWMCKTSWKWHYIRNKIASILWIFARAIFCKITTFAC